MATLIFSSVSFSDSNRSPSNLIGASIYTDLGVDYYVAVLYRNSSTSEEEMLIKVHVNRWSTRRWRSLWQNNIAINNEVSDSEEINQAIINFIYLPESSFKKGDEISIKLLASNKTVISVNNISMITTDGDQLFNMLKNTWLGKFPPSRIFKENLQGQRQADGNLAATLDQPISENRLAIASKWNNQKQNEHQAQQVQQKQAEQQVALEKEKILARHAEKKRQAEQEKQLKLQKIRKEAEKKRQQELAKKRELERKRQELAKKREVAKRKKQQQAAQKKAAQQYWAKHYQWQLVRQVYESVKYPPWAKQFKQQGLVEIKVSVSDDGSVFSSENLTPDTSDILVQEVDKRLKQAVSDIERPSQLAKMTTQFVLPYEFNLRRQPTLPIAEPVKPNFIK